MLLKKKFIAITLLFSALILLLAVNSLPNPKTDKLDFFFDGEAEIIRLSDIHTQDESIIRYEINLPRGTARAWIFEDGSVFWCERSSAFSLSSDGFDIEKQLTEESRSLRIVRGPERFVIIQPPLARENVVLDGTNYIADEDNNGSATLLDGKLEVAFNGEVSDWWAYLSPGKLNDWDWISECTLNKFGSTNRMTIDGYYLTTPTDYSPSGENTFYLNPAAHIAGKLSRNTADQHANRIAIGMLDIQREHYSEEGFIPTAPQSNWLYTDFDIPANFYDTRFNTDFAHALLASGVKEFQTQIINYTDFLINHALRKNHPTQNGFLVSDYSHPDAGKITHSSLNHHVAEIQFLLETKDIRAEAVAKKMLNGIEDTAENWILPDGNLHYAYLSDGTYGKDDYPTLTYNDLFLLNDYIGENNALSLLMDSKKRWMNANRIYDYLTEEQLTRKKENIKMKILIMTDIEGISGVDNWEQVHKKDWDGYEYARERLMADTNAAIEGAIRAGADTVYVVDGHGSGDSFIKELLNPRAIQISVSEYVDIFEREKIDACLEIGVHAKPGTTNAFLEHVQSSKNWFSYKLNGKEYGEIAQGALYAGAHGVPFVMVSGDDATCNEAIELLGENIAYAEVKRGISWKEAESINLKKAERKIRDAVCDGINRRSEFEPFTLSLPLTIEVTFVRADICEEYLEKYPHLERVDSRTLRRVTDEIKTYKDVLLY